MARLHAIRRVVALGLNRGLSRAWAAWARAGQSKAVLRAACCRISDMRSCQAMHSLRAVYLESVAFLRGLRMGSSFWVCALQSL